jgi:DNA-binding CsgD family transcriptional regulator
MSNPSPIGNSQPLVGRERELGVLRQHLDAAIHGHGSLVLIGGEAGIGKTALAEASCREAQEQGGLVLTGRCYDLTETPPYGPWVDLFDRCRQRNDIPPLPVAFAQRGTVGAVASQAALFRDVLDFFAALTSTRSLALLLDDAHGMDPASLDLLRFLARARSSLPLLLITTYRSDELTRRHPLYTLLPTLVREASAARIDLRPLDDDAARTLVEARFHLPTADAERLVGFVQRRAEGNPLFTGEVLRSLIESGVLRQQRCAWQLGDLARVALPPLLRQIIDARVARLDAEGQRLLAVAAVVGHEVALVLWALAAEVDEASLLGLIEAATTANLLVENPDGMHVRFAHALVREAVYEGISPARRRLLHRRIAGLLVDQPQPDPDAVAMHFHQASDARAVAWLVRAGERAQAAFAWLTAAQRFEAALALMARADVDAQARGWLLLRTARLLRYVDVARGAALADEAVSCAMTVSDRGLAAFARYTRGLLTCAAGDVAGGLPEMDAGVAALEALSEAERALVAAHAAAIDAPLSAPDWRGSLLLWSGQAGPFREARERGERLLAEAAGGGEEMEQALRDGYHGLGAAYAALGMPCEAATAYARACDAYLRAGHHALAAMALWRELDLLALPYRTDDLTARRRLAERAVAAWARASGAFPATVPPQFPYLPLLVLEGDWDEAERLAVAVSAEEWGLKDFPTLALRYRATLLHIRGDTAGAWRAVREGLPGGHATAPGTVVFVDVATALQRTAAALALDAGDLLTAKGWLEGHDRWLAWSGTVLGRSEGQVLWAQYHRQAGDVDAAHAHAERALMHAREPRQPLALVAAHRTFGELVMEVGRYAEAEHHLRESLALAEACAAPYERALTLLSLTELNVAQGKNEHAHALLAAARALLVRLAARLALDRADALTARLTDDGPPATAYPGGLTAREVEVLRHLAAGESNQEIADALFLSLRTVNRHIANLYRKIEARGRADATAFAFRHHLA